MMTDMIDLTIMIINTTYTTSIIMIDTIGILIDMMTSTGIMTITILTDMITGIVTIATTVTADMITTPLIGMTMMVTDMTDMMIISMTHTIIMTTTTTMITMGMITTTHRLHTHHIGPIRMRVIMNIVQEIIMATARKSLFVA